MKSFNNVAFLATASAHTFVSGIQYVTPSSWRVQLSGDNGNTVVIDTPDNAGYTLELGDASYTTLVGAPGSRFIVHNRVAPDATTGSPVTYSGVVILPGFTAEIFTGYVGGGGPRIICVSATAPNGSVKRYAVRDFVTGDWTVSGSGAHLVLWTAAERNYALLNSAGYDNPSMKIFETVAENTYEEVIAGLQNSTSGGVSANIDVPGAVGFNGRSIIYVG